MELKIASSDYLSGTDFNLSSSRFRSVFVIAERCEYDNKSGLTLVPTKLSYYQCVSTRRGGHIQMCTCTALKFNKTIKIVWDLSTLRVDGLRCL